MTIDVAASPAISPAPSRAALRRLHGAAVVRIVFGVIWAIDAIFKFLPGFVHGQTLTDELGSGSKIHTPVIHQWIQLWLNASQTDPAAFAIGTGVVEVVIAVCLLVGAFSNAVFIGSAIWSFGIWSAAEGFHLPWSKSGITDLGPSVGYIVASLVLFYAVAGATWSVDGRLKPVMARFGLGWLCSPTVAELHR
jgi:nitrite reductase (NO-forming)